MCIAEREKDVLERFGAKHAADLGAILPAVALPAIGAFLGKRVGGPQHGDIGALAGGIGGGVLGRVLSEDVRAQQPPPNAPFGVDPTSNELPPWALPDPRLLRMASAKLAASAHEGLRDVVLGDMLGPAYPLAEGARSGGLGGALKHLAGSSAGIAAGGLLGHGLGQLLPETKVWGIPLSTILSGLGATIGGVKGLDVARYGLKPALLGR